LKKIIREYWLEIIAGLFILFGLFLLLEQFSLRLGFRRLLFRSIGIFRETAGGLSQQIYNYLAGFTLSDLIGWIFIFLAIFFVLWRIRVRFVKSDYWLATACPRCGSALHRVKRSSWDRFLSKTILPHARRYLCSNRECGWSGLRHHEHRHSHQVRTTPI
jgi:hypothetical protein